MVDADDATKTWNWTQDVAVIATSYQTSEYFDFFQENLLGINPSKSDDETMLNKQFLWSFLNSNPSEGYSESYAFNGGKNFLVGGTTIDYNAMNCTNEFDEDVGCFQGSRTTLAKKNVLPDANIDVFYVPPPY